MEISLFLKFDLVKWMFFSLNIAGWYRTQNVYYIRIGDNPLTAITVNVTVKPDFIFYFYHDNTFL
jgi:hypothetical protein